jgi:ABC-type uncharacterized transport system YnjBCD substrate-binding protein
MKARGTLLLAAALLLAATLAFAGGGGEAGGKAAPVKVVYMTAGDVNMLALGQNVIGPALAEKYPNIQVMTVHTGPGNAGSQLILEKLEAESKSNKEAWDVDVAMVHQIFMKWAMEKDLLMPYAKEVPTWAYVTPFAERLGVDIEIPHRCYQRTACYHPDYVSRPGYAELVDRLKLTRQFGYNGIKGGMSGVGFVIGWVYWKTGKYQKYAVTGPVEKAEFDTWEQAFKDLGEFNKHVTFTGGNVGTLDALNRGEIWMGPVWVDMFFTFMNEGKLDPKTRMILPEHGMPGQPMYFVIPKKAAHPEEAKKFVEYVTSPEFQAKEIVQRFNWYPGIDGAQLKGAVPQEIYDKIYGDVTPADLVKKGQAFPLADYMTAMLEGYEKWIK